MTDTTLTTIVTSTPLDLAVSAWLNAHGSYFDEEGEQKHTRTSGAYEYTMKAFREGLQRQGLDLDSDPSVIALLAEVFARGSVKEGKHVAKTTVNQRLACISSFYRYARKKKFLTENPIEMAEREKKIQDYAHAQALDEEAVQDALYRIDQSTPKGKRDYAILSILFQTARRAQEVATLKWQHVSISAKGKATLTFEHAKGDEVMMDELPVPVTNALLRWLQRYYGDLGKLTPATPLWVSLAHDSSYGKPLGYQSINALCKKHLHISKVHVTRHTAAHSMEKLGLNVSEIQARLGHKSLATTGRYLASLRRAENRKADELAALYGIK
jgi:integrase